MCKLYVVTDNSAFNSNKIDEDDYGYLTPSNSLKLHQSDYIAIHKDKSEVGNLPINGNKDKTDEYHSLQTNPHDL